ncbi:MAG: hypothetical protein V4572_04975 [Bacteroidota bacterium]
MNDQIFYPESIADELIEISPEQVEILQSFIKKDNTQEIRAIDSSVAHNFKKKSWTGTHFFNFSLDMRVSAEKLKSGKEPIYHTSMKLSNVGKERVLIPVYFNGISGKEPQNNEKVIPAIIAFFTAAVSFITFWKGVFEIAGTAWTSLSELITKSNAGTSNDKVADSHKSEKDLKDKKDDIIKEDPKNTTDPKIPGEIVAVGPPGTLIQRNKNGVSFLASDDGKRKFAIYQITMDNKWYFCTPTKWLEGIYDKDNGGSYGIPLLNDAATIIIYYFPNKDEAKYEGGNVWGRLLLYTKD